MQWSPQQEKALAAVSRWLREKPKQVFQLAGYAGTGKTTLAKHLIAGIEGRVYFVAFTGKAAYVLARSGATNVSTIHKLIYQPKDKSQQRLKELEAERAKLLTHNPIPRTMVDKLDKAIQLEQGNLARPSFQLNLESELTGAALVVLDEYSMANKQVKDDLLSFGVPVLALGDPGQLPPPVGAPGFTDPPDILLTEIHRQAENNPIIWMSREVREGRVLKPGNYGDSRVVPYRNVPKDELQRLVLGTDQLLVGRNATRKSSNWRARELLGFGSEYPMANDKLVCLRNNHDLGLLNGQIWRTRQDAIVGHRFVELKIESEEGTRAEVKAHTDYFKGGEPDIWSRKDAEEFDFGYALTVHKSQGSQWNNILLFDEWYMKDREKWLYTGITRAAERIDVVCM